MKWVYRILRLFFCPHKWEVLGKNPLLREDNERFGDMYILKCKHCGKLNTKKVSVDS